MPTLTRLDTLNSNYRVALIGTDEQGKTLGGSDGGIIATLPETFDIGTSTEWEQLFPNGAISNLATFLLPHGSSLSTGVTALSGLAGRAFGYNGQSPILSQRIWTSSSPIQFKIPFQFDGVYNAREEVMDKILALLKLTLPSAVSPATGTKIDAATTLSGPGPHIFGDNKYKVSLHIGNYLVFDQVIVEQVYANLESMITRRGEWISATVDVSMSTSRIFTKQDLDKAFNKTSQNQTFTFEDSKSAISSTVKNIGSNITNAGTSLLNLFGL